MTELYTLMRYLQYDTLKDMGLLHFDSWAATFGETVTAIEIAVSSRHIKKSSKYGAGTHYLTDVFANREKDLDQSV